MDLLVEISDANAEQDDEKVEEVPVESVGEVQIFQHDSQRVIVAKWQIFPDESQMPGDEIFQGINAR